MYKTDGDGYGDAQSTGGITAGLDCNDLDASIHPFVDGLTDGIDRNCDHSTESTKTEMDMRTWNWVEMTATTMTLLPILVAEPESDPSLCRTMPIKMVLDGWNHNIQK